MRNILKYTAFLLFFTGYCMGISAQDSVPKVQKPQQSVRSNNKVVNNQNPTNARPKIQTKRLSAADSQRFAAQRDSIQKATTGAGSAFDIGAPVMPQTASVPVVSAVPRLENSDNPFDIVSGGPVSDKGSISGAASQIKVPTPPASPQPSLLEPSIYANNFLFWIFLVSLILMAFVVANARSSIANAYSAVMSDSALRQIYKEPVGWGSAPYISLYVLYWLSLAIFIYLLLSHFGVSMAYGKVTTFLLCLAGVSIIYLFKHIVLYCIAQIFPVSKEVRTYNFIILTVGVILGLLLMPLNIFIAYAPDSVSSLFIYVTFGVIGLAYLVRSLRGLMVASPFFTDNKFHFLLYLCTVELAPLLIIIKLVSSKI